MALDACNDAISAAVGRELTDREKAAISRRALALKKKIDLAKDPNALESTLRDFHDEVKANAILADRNTALNWRAFSALKAWRENVGPIVKNPAEVVKALYRGSLFNFNGSKDSLANLAIRESNTRSGTFLAELAKNNLVDVAFSGALDKQIVAAQHDIRNGKVPDVAKYGKNAVAIAQAIENNQESLRLDMNKAGAWITRNSDRLFKRTHDANKIAKAGGNKWGSNESEAAWSKFVSDRMDWNKAFDGEMADAGPAERQKVLSGLFAQFKEDTHLAPSGDTPPSGVGTRNFGKKYGHAREIVFKSPQADLEYQQAFGKGNSVAENAVHALSSGGKDLAIMRKLGPNPEQTLDKFVEDWKQDLKENNRGEGMKALQKQADKEKATTWRLLTQSTGHPNENFVGRWLSTIRHTTNTAALGMSIFSVPGDLALRASMLHQYSGEGFAKSLFNATTRQLTGYGISDAQKAKIMAEAGIRAEGIHMPLSPDLVDHVGTGEIARYNQLVMRMTGHAPWTNRIRSNSLVADAYRHWTFRDQTFNQLPAGMQMALNQFGIDKPAWDVLRKSDATKLDNGMSAFMPSNIREMDPKNFASLTGSDKPTDYQMEKARETLADNYRNLLGEMADRATSSPSIAVRSFMGLGSTDAGTVTGELMRGALQLKGFVFNYMRNHLGREIFGYSSEAKTFPQAMADMMRGKNPKGFMGLAKLISAGVAISFVTNAMRDIATGKTPQNPLSEEAIARAFARQSFGLYSDFLFQKSRPDETLFDKVGEMAGPEISLAADAYDFSHRVASQIVSKKGMTQKNIDSDAQKLFGTAYRNTPGTNLFWDKWAMDYFVLNNISEQLNPGYQERLQKYVKKSGQSYIAGSAGLK